MIVNIPLNSNTNESETQQYNQYNEIKEYRGNGLNNMTHMSMSPVPKWNDTYSSAENTIHQTIISNSTITSTSMIGQSSKCQTTKQVPDIPLLKLVENDEMETVPK